MQVSNPRATRLIRFRRVWDLADDAERSLFRDEGRSRWPRVRTLISDARASDLRTPALLAACPGAPVLIYALSGLGKSTLAAAHPQEVRDADDLLYAAVAVGFPELDPRARLRAWRDLCHRRPWMDDGDDLLLWAAVRRAFIEPFVEAMREGAHRLVLTSLIDPPWLVSAYYGVERGGYLAHLRAAGREADNRQSEAMNDRLEGYSPLVRLAPGSYLEDREELLAVIGTAGGRRDSSPSA